MSTALRQQPGLPLLLVRHLCAYLRIVAEDTTQVAADLQRRALALLVALVALGLCLAVGGAWIFALVWNTPLRNPVLGMMVGGFALLAILAAVHARRPAAAGQLPYARLKAELATDESLLNSWGQTDETPQSAAETLAVLRRVANSNAGDRFPRSTIMRVALHWLGFNRA